MQNIQLEYILLRPATRKTLLREKTVSIVESVVTTVENAPVEISFTQLKKATTRTRTHRLTESSLSLSFRVTLRDSLCTAATATHVYSVDVKVKIG